MGFDAHVLEVMISTPGDTGEEVAAVTNALHGWNSSRARGAQTILLPRFWKTAAVPTLSDAGGQSVINSQLVDNADIVLVFFDSRLGRATADAVSGTAEEIERAADQGKPIHVWFSDEPIPRNVDLDQLERLNAFRGELEAKGLLGVYTDTSDLAYRVRDAIEADVEKLGLGAPSVKRKGEHALPRLTLERGVDSRGKTSIVMILENKSQTVTAEQLEVDFGPWESCVYREFQEPINLPPSQPIRWNSMFAMGDPTQNEVVITWRESGEPHSVTLPITTA
ncbi:hypothetical protein [Tsukamurella tyrosinosolvens]|uniref:hypothetical protein n=1 Tax=Tsukamurella tyrosinosolvens TaxID=57704 RepID=UPI002DD4382B|nr:hypothetical protein [Tsukamurella tyrosinosolvens]MEC4612577.1 hypothetical protein [Tsukamurella tyrosinosolvens]